MLKNLLAYRGKTILHSNGIEMHVDEAMMHGAVRVNRYKRMFQWNMHSFFRYAYRHIDKLLTVSYYDYNYAIGTLKMPVEKVGILEPCLHDLYFEHNTEEVQKQPLILYCGGWLPIKGVEAIEKALPSVLRKHPYYSLRLIGVGESFQKNRIFPADVLSQIQVIPYVHDRKNLKTLFSECSIFIFPSLADSFGLVVAEAMYCGCASIVSRTGIGYSLVHKEEAWVLKEPTAALLEDALFALIKDEGLCTQMRFAGRRRVGQLRWSMYGQNLEAILVDLCNDK
jgi:glycosyltransferase involved in cell wall biosynthesis